MLSQKKQILDHLRSIDPVTKDYRGLTPYEAIGLYRCFRLAARIEELRDEGHKIVSVRKTDRTGKTYAKYFIGASQLAHTEGAVFSMPRNRR